MERMHSPQPKKSSRLSGEQQTSIIYARYYKNVYQSQLQATLQRIPSTKCEGCLLMLMKRFRLPLGDSTRNKVTSIERGECYRRLVDYAILQ